MEDRWLSVEEIAAHLGVNRDAVYRWIEEKHMPWRKRDTAPASTLSVS